MSLTRKPSKSLCEMGCRCRACRSPQRAAGIAEPAPRWRLSSAAIVMVAALVFYTVAVGSIVLLLWGNV